MGCPGATGTRSTEGQSGPVWPAWPDRILRWIEPEDNPRGTVYGTIAAGLVIAAEDPGTSSYPRLVAASLVATVIYWLAHGYALWMAERFRSGEPDADATGPGLRRALVHEWPVAEGAAIPIITLLIAWAAGASLAGAEYAAVWSAAGALAMFEVAGGLRRRLQPLQLLARTCFAILLGAGLFAVKNLLH